MGTVYKTTLVPGKLDLLAHWLPTRSWYTGTGGTPDLEKTGGFRLDDPDGEVGVEFLVATDSAGDHPRTYLVPMTYRGAPLEGADSALIGTCEYGVLGPRWVYDGTRDPVGVERLLALLMGEAEPQAQSISDTPDPTVTRSYSGAAGLEWVEVGDGPGGTDITARTDAGPVTVRVNRVLHAEEEADDGGPAPIGDVVAPWRTPGGEVRGRYVVVLPGVS